VARSTYIYIVKGTSGAILAAFTVKHECISYLGNAVDMGADLSKWDVLRLRDGPSKMSEYRAYRNAAEFLQLPA